MTPAAERVAAIAARWITIEKAGEALTMKPEAVRQLILAGEIYGVKVGKEWRVDRKTVEAFLESSHTSELKTEGIMQYANTRTAAQILGISQKELLVLYRKGTILAKEVSRQNFVVNLDRLREYAAQENTVVRGCITKKNMGWPLSRMLSDAKKRARIKKIPFDLSEYDVREMFFMSQGKCTLTGLPFRHPDGEKVRYLKNPYAPSLDRIDNRLGYTAGNVRLICVAMNLAMHQWSLGFFDELAEARRKFKKKWRQ